MKAKGIIIGVLTGICFLVGEYILSFLGFPYPVLLFFILFIAIYPASLLAFKLLYKQNLTVDLALLIGISANIAWTFLFVIEIILINGLNFYEVAGITFFSFLFGFVFTAIASNFFAKLEANNSNIESE